MGSSSPPRARGRTCTHRGRYIDRQTICFRQTDRQKKILQKRTKEKPGNSGTRGSHPSISACPPPPCHPGLSVCRSPRYQRQSVRQYRKNSHLFSSSLSTTPPVCLPVCPLPDGPVSKQPHHRRPNLISQPDHLYLHSRGLTLHDLHTHTHTHTDRQQSSKEGKQQCCSLHAQKLLHGVHRAHWLTGKKDSWRYTRRLPLSDSPYLPSLRESIRTGEPTRDQ